MSQLQDERADQAIKAMVTAVVGTAVIPAYVNWALTASALGAGVVAIGLCYGVQLTKDEAWKLVKQFFMAAGTWFIAMNFGSKFIAMILTSTGIGYGPAVALDATISATAAYAVGASAKEYFKGERDKGKIGKVFRDTFHQSKKQSA